MPTTIEPSTPAFSAIWRIGACSARLTMLMPASWSSLSPFSRDRVGCLQQRDAAADHDAFLDRGARGIERVIDAVLALLHLDLGGAADLDHRNTAGQLGQALLQLLLVVVGGGLLDLHLDLGDARLDVLLLAGAVDDGGVLLLDAHALGACPACRA